MTPDHHLEFKKIFFPFAEARAKCVQKKGSRFAYYTTAETALKVLKNREIWMRNSRVMNDFREVEHGKSCVEQAYRCPEGAELNTQLEKIFSGLQAEIEILFNKWIGNIQFDTYITCLSEHSPDEDKHGRLSMWRAYGGNAGVALILNGDVLHRPSQNIGVYSSPVRYSEAEGIKKELTAVASNIRNNHEWVRTFGREKTKNAIFQMLRFAVICTKHPAFREEKEWRIIASPSMENSTFLTACTEVLGGIPQKVIKLKLEDRLDDDLIGINPTYFIDRLLIGPCEHWTVVFEALCEALRDAGVPRPESKITNTSIPLRAKQG